MKAGSHVFLNGERLSCPAQNFDHLMTSDVNKWRDITQNSSVLLTFLYVKRVEIVKWNM